MTAVDRYLHNLPSSQRTQLERIRILVGKIVPDAEEGISYGIPVFKYKKKYLIGFAGYKNHMSLFPTPGPIDILKSELTQFRLAKGTIQFTEDNPISEALIQKLVTLRQKEIIGS